MLNLMLPPALRKFVANSLTRIPRGSHPRRHRHALDRNATVPALLEVLETRQLLSGQTIVVNTTYDGPSNNQPPNTTSLRQAVAEANIDSVADTIVFDNSLSGQTITLTQGELLITTPVTITGLGANHLTVSGGWNGTVGSSTGSRIFHIDDSTPAIQYVAITGLKITRGNFLTGNGGALTNNENLSLTDVVVSDSSVSHGDQYGDAYGGGIYNSGTITASNSIISDNSTTAGYAYGGGVYNTGTFISSGNTITGNSAIDQTFAYGGAIHNSGTFTSTNDTITGNSAQTDPAFAQQVLDLVRGGAIFNSGTLTITNGVLEENSASSSSDAYGGAVYSSGTLTSFNSSISRNTVLGGRTVDGGGLSVWGTYWSTNDTIALNRGEAVDTGYAATGGGLSVMFGTAMMINATITGNTLTTATTTGSSGAGVSADNNSFIINSVILGNSSQNVVNNVSGGDPTNIDPAKNILTGVLPEILQVQNSGTLNFNPLLADNGGPVNTVALPTGSSAIHAGVSLATVTANGDAGTTLTIDDSTFIPVGASLLIGTEIVQVTAVNSTTHALTLLRAQHGTAQSNLNGLAVRLAFDARGLIRLQNDIGAFSASSSPAIAVLDPGGQYTGTSFPATGTLTGLEGSPTSTLESVGLTFTYYSGSTASGAPLSGAPTNAGTYTVVVSFPGSQHYDTNSETATFIITAATPILSVIHSGGTYTGTPLPATASLAGTGGTPASTLESIGLTLAYYYGSTISGTPLSGAPTNAGTYTAVASFAGSTNYASGKAFVIFTITRATPTVQAVNNGGAFSGAPFPATATVTGVNNSPDSTLEGVGLTITYYSGSTATGTPLSGPPTAIGTYTAVASFAGSDNHTAASDTVTFAVTRKTKRQTIRIDNVKYSIDAPVMTGLQLLQLAGKTPPENYALTQIKRKGQIQTAGLNQFIDFTIPGPWRFTTRLLP